MFLLDTDILSALRRRGRHPEVVGWLEGQRTVDLHLSVVTVGEIERSISQQERLGPVHTKQPEFDTIQVWKLQKLSTNA